MERGAVLLKEKARLDEIQESKHACWHWVLKALMVGSLLTVVDVKIKIDAPTQCSHQKPVLL